MTDVELVPVYVENLNRILPKGSVVPVPLLTRIRHYGGQAGVLARLERAQQQAARRLLGLLILFNWIDDVVGFLSLFIPKIGG